ncbi:hypothetical protein V9K98_41150 [Kribbella sp. CCNWLW197]
MPGGRSWSTTPTSWRRCHPCTSAGRCGSAELDEADHLHAVNPARPATTSQVHGPTWTDVFGEELVAIAAERTDLVAVTAAMSRPAGLFPLACRYPERVYDVGIAEQHAVTSAVGLAAAGLHPVVAIYSTFLNRAFDQVLIDAALPGAGHVRP